MLPKKVGTSQLWLSFKKSNNITLVNVVVNRMFTIAR